MVEWSKHPRLTRGVRELEFRATRRHDCQSHLGHFSFRLLLSTEVIKDHIFEIWWSSISGTQDSKQQKKLMKPSVNVFHRILPKTKRIAPEFMQRKSGVFYYAVFIDNF